MLSTVSSKPVKFLMEQQELSVVAYVTEFTTIFLAGACLDQGKDMNKDGFGPPHSFCPHSCHQSAIERFRGPSDHHPSRGSLHPNTGCPNVTNVCVHPMQKQLAPFLVPNPTDLACGCKIAWKLSMPPASV